MAALTASDGAPSTPSGFAPDATDPLVEQLNSVLRFTNSRIASSRRGRRFSDTDQRRPSPDATTTSKSNPICVLSRDGNRWLPAPDEQPVPAATRPLPSTAVSQSGPPVDQEPHCCHSTTCSMLRVFATTELLELILTFLETKEILPLRRTNRLWLATILDSPQLRLHFFTFGQWYRPAADFQLLPLSIPGLQTGKGQTLHLGQWVSISLTPEAARQLAPPDRPQKRVRSRSIYEGLRGGLGPRARGLAAGDAWSASGAAATTTSRITSLVPLDRLFVTQPPLVGMQAHIVYSSSTTAASSAEEAVEDADTALPACAKLSRDTGITLGFLAETAHSLFTNAETSSNRHAVRVIFRAIMSFCAPDEAPRKRNGKKIVTRLGA